MKMKKMIYLAFALLFMSANSMNAQVAIGTTNPNMEPHTGAILDLGQVAAKNLGLLLPQVKLNSATDKDAIQGKAPADGLLVYNPGSAGLDAGAYVWYDDSWHKIGGAFSTCGDELKDIDGNTYATALFGDAGCWMQENLKTKHYADGTLISYKNGSNNSTQNTNLAEFDYPNRNEQSDAYGLVYTWAAASRRTDVSTNEGNMSDQTPVLGVCPDGWHLPSDYEWSQLEEVIDKDVANKYAASPANTATVDYFGSAAWRGNSGEKMKSTSNVTGVNYATNGNSNTTVNNGYDAYLSAHVDSSGAAGVGAMGYGSGAYFWTASCNRMGKAWHRGLINIRDGANRTGRAKEYLFSVRCKKND